MSLSETIHASCVAIDGRGVLIAGPSGSGKSDLALRLIDRGATLVSDDYTELSQVGRSLHANAPATIAGKIEVRALGICALPHVEGAPVALFVAADPAPERMPEPATMTVAGVELPLLALALTEPSAPLKVELALARVVG